MKLPRLLIILVVILVVLQGASCALPALDIDLDLSPEGLGEILDGVTPEPPDVNPADVTTCDPAVTSGPLVFAGACAIDIEAASGSVRRLTLRNTGAAEVEMSMPAHDGATQDLEVDAVEPIDVPPNERSEVALVCQALPPLTTCRVRLGG
jgi:hypothetical protein